MIDDPRRNTPGRRGTSSLSAAEIVAFTRVVAHYGGPHQAQYWIRIGHETIRTLLSGGFVKPATLERVRAVIAGQT